MGLLTALLLIPLAGALVVMAAPARLARDLALAVSVLALALAGKILLEFDLTASGAQLLESHVWNPRLGTHFSLAVDGISLSMVMLTTVLVVCALSASHNVRESPRVYFTLMLILESAILGVFMARDWALFYVFWEFTLIPLFFLIDRWGGAGRHRAALNFVIYTLGGSVFMLVALLALYDLLPQHTFDMLAFAEGGRMLPEKTQILLFIGLFIGFGVKLPVFPLHGWLPLAHVEAPSPVSILLSGILLKMGAYGLLRAIDTLPAAALALQGWMMALALFSLIYGAVLAFRQNDLKAMIAYASVSHMGIVLLGIAGLNAPGLTGAVLMMVGHGITAALLFLLVGQLYERTYVRDLNRYGRLREHAPRFAFLLSFAFVAAAGLPGSGGFIAELHVLIGGFRHWGATMIFVSIGVLVSTAYALRVSGHFLAARQSNPWPALVDLNRREMALAGGLAVTTLLLGLFPGPGLALIGQSVGEIARRFPG